MDVLLIEPPYYKLMGEVQFWVPIGLMNLAHFLNVAGFETRIYNADATPEFDEPKTLLYSEKFYRSGAVNDSASPLWQHTFEELRQIVDHESPKAIGISVKSDTVVSALYLLRFIRKRWSEIRLFVGGVHFTSVLDKTFLSVSDAIMVGEGEEMIVKVVKELLQAGHSCTESKIYINSKEFDLNSYVDMDLSQLETSQQQGISRLTKLMIASSRGCPFKCAFCFKSIDNNTAVRYVSGDLIGRLMIKSYKKYGISKFYFVDDTFGLNENQLLEFSNSIKGYENIFRWSCMSHVNVLTKERLSLLQKLGCSAIHLGVESGSQRMLDLMQKNIRIDDVVRCADLVHQFGIELRAFILCGIPGETSDDLNLTKQMLQQIRPNEIAAQVYIPYQNTSLFQQLLQKRVIETIDWSCFVKSHIRYGIVQQNICDDPVIEDFFHFVDNWNASMQP